MTIPVTPMIDLGEITLPKGTTVYVSATKHDPAFSGVLTGNWCRIGVPYAAMVYDGDRVRHVHVERIGTEPPARRRRSRKVDA